MDKAKRVKILFYASGLALLVIVLDQLLKWVMLEQVIRVGLNNMGVETGMDQPLSFWAWMMSAPEMLPFYTLDVLPFFNVTMVWNHGVSFGLFASEGDIGRIFLIGLACVISAVMAYLMTKSESRVEVFTMATVIGGALGNVIDRIRFGAVADFIHVHAFDWHFPVFNIADAAITLGIAFLVVYGLFFSSSDEDRNVKDSETREVS